MSFSKIVVLITALTRDPAVIRAVMSLSGARVSVAQARSWDRLKWLIRERPVTGLVLDSDALEAGREGSEDRLVELGRLFPSVGAVLVARPELGPVALFRLGRAGFADLTLLPLDSSGRELRKGVARANLRSTSAVVTRGIGMHVPVWVREVVRAALDGAILGWKADELATAAGWTRAHLSVRLRGHGVPSAGHLLLWAKLLHAGRWLTEPGRSAESVSRQLEYSNGAAFRRALRNYLGLTPTEVIERGGLEEVLGRFLDVCGLGDSLGGGRSVA